MRHLLGYYHFKLGRISRTLFKVVHIFCYPILQVDWLLLWTVCFKILLEILVESRLKFHDSYYVDFLFIKELIKLLNQSNEYFLKPDSCMYWNSFLSCGVMKLTLAYCHLLWKRILDIHPSCLISRHAFDLLCWNRDQMVLLNTLVFSSPFDYRRLQWHLPLQPLSLPESNSLQYLQIDFFAKRLTSQG